MVLGACSLIPLKNNSHSNQFFLRLFLEAIIQILLKVFVIVWKIILGSNCYLINRVKLNLPFQLLFKHTIYISLEHETTLLSLSIGLDPL